MPPSATIRATSAASAASTASRVRSGVDVDAGSGQHRRSPPRLAAGFRAVPGGGRRPASATAAPWGNTSRARPRPLRPPVKQGYPAAGGSGEGGVPGEHPAVEGMLPERRVRGGAEAGQPEGDQLPFRPAARAAHTPGRRRIDGHRIGPQADQQRLEVVGGLPGQRRLDEAAAFVEHDHIEAPPHRHVDAHTERHRPSLTAV